MRYDSHASDFIYAGYGVGRAFAMVGLLDNARPGYRELIGGVGTRWTFGTNSVHSFALATTLASDARYVQVYYLPSLRVGPVTTRATIEGYVPVNSRGTRQLAVSPVSATALLARGLEAGVALDVSAQRGTSTALAAGLEVRRALPKATLGADFLMGVAHSPGHLRVFFSASM